LAIKGFCIKILCNQNNFREDVRNFSNTIRSVNDTSETTGIAYVVSMRHWAKVGFLYINDVRGVLDNEGFDTAETFIECQPSQCTEIWTNYEGLIKSLGEILNLKKSKKSRDNVSLNYCSSF
jgi:hypothetical protein